ncbi:MAG: putative hydrolase of the superfamily [Patescibacteria group bacterium]|jgi:FMN phosphatase YigB (HAD superfamily)|nr:putative hydrolase of the superfamily [Patescibacteria group bacterium]
MNKIVCLDLDGVSVAEHERFSARLIEKQGYEISDAVNEYFSKFFGAVMKGEASLVETITPYVPRFNWDGDTSSLLRFWFDGEKTPIQPVLDAARNIRDSGTPTYVVTDNPAERTNELWDEMLSKYFTNKYVSGETGLKKSNPALWTRIAKETGVSLGDIFFADDDFENVNVATSTGVQAILFTSPEQLKKSIDQFLL